MKKTLIIISILFYISLLNIKKVKSREIIIPKNSIRLRIIANSDSDYDQNIKMKLNIKLQEKINELLLNTKNTEEAKKVLKNKLSDLNNYIEKILKEENYNESYYITYTDAFFPEKKYNGLIYEKGYYETLLITLGNGKGSNWWCVLFPPLCLVETEDNPEYKIFIKEIIDKYF